jgi:putative FmdB family regulatory protein
MPLYEYRCSECRALTTALRPMAAATEPVACHACGAPAARIVSRPSVHRDRASKLDRLDPKYDRLVDRAMAGTPQAEPDHYLKRMKPLSDD